MHSSSDFRHIARKGVADKAERLFRASISAYCCLSHPTRAEAQQLEDLALPLYNAVSPEILRYVAAALSECSLPPAALVARLCEEAPEISAPLLMRTSALSDVDLIALIARKGAGHARVIAKRAGLHPTIAALAAAIERKDRLRRAEVRNQVSGASQTGSPKTAFASVLDTVSKRTAEQARAALRAMMVSPSQLKPAPQDTYARLRETALSGSGHLFHAALAEALRVDVAGARALVESSDQTALMSALRSLDLPDDRAFLLVACAFPSSFPHPVSIRQFLERYGSIDVETANDRLRSLRADALANAFNKPEDRAGTTARRR